MKASFTLGFTRRIYSYFLIFIKFNDRKKEKSPIMIQPCITYLITKFINFTHYALVLFVYCGHDLLIMISVICKKIDCDHFFV